MKTIEQLTAARDQLSENGVKIKHGETLNDDYKSQRKKQLKKMKLLNDAITVMRSTNSNQRIILKSLIKLKRAETKLIGDNCADKISDKHFTKNMLINNHHQKVLNFILTD